ncbi:MAG TPA: VOC family protein [Burkholderiaceae bacterium]|nr:VOC family protein [Burkholderiaceae bacterium]
MKSQIDHIVVVAQCLEQGIAWCEATLGITPHEGGEHKQFGTHNCLFKIATPAFPLAYFEIIAINSNATNNIALQAINTPSTGQKRINSARWFDMDDAALQKAVAKEPRLVHFVAQSADIQAAKSALKLQGIDRGPAVEASRHTRKGRLEWKITVRDDGQRLFNGALPSLIQWGKATDAEPLRLHPRNTLPRSGVSLQSIAVTSPNADKLQAAYAAIGLTGVTLLNGEANLAITLRTPKGEVVLQSGGI